MSKSDIFETLSLRIKFRFNKSVSNLKSYLRKLLFPIRFFPLKLVTYTGYYLIKFIVKIFFTLLSLLFSMLIFPFKSLKNFLKSVFFLLIFIYLLASFFVTLDYLRTQYGFYGKFLCSFGAKVKLQNSVMRIVGGYSEGTGFFIADNQVLTNFHVIADEPSPKIIFPDGKFITPTKILGDQSADLAVLYTDKNYPDKVLPLPNKVILSSDEPLESAGYPLGTQLSGKATVVHGNFVDYRKSSKSPVYYIQTNISLVPGMSGGPLTDQCGNVVGINTLSLAGLSLFIGADQVKLDTPNFSDAHIKKIDVDPSKSPEEAVRAYYTYLKARRMDQGFNLLSRGYKQKSTLEEWTNRFKDILDVDVIKTELVSGTDDAVSVKFTTKNWVDGEAIVHYYEGTWKMVKEDGVYKILSGKINEVVNPDPSWFYQ